MEAASLALSAVQALLAALQCTDLKQLSSLVDSESHLNELKDTISTVKSVLLDAEKKQELNDEAHNYIQKLKDAVYDADDLIDEALTIAAQDGKVSPKVHGIFSSFKSLFVDPKMSKRVLDIKEKLEGIANDHSKFGFGLDSQATRKISRETCSNVDVSDIIGRDDDVKKIVSILLDNNTKQDVNFLSIVGMGGLGKTALAQLVFKHHRVVEAFQVKLWTCVSDHRRELDVKEILCNILNSGFGENHQASTMEWAQRQFRENLANKRFLLVLDDVWTENGYQWGNLIGCLKKVGLPGCWIVVTTRSNVTADIVGGFGKHDLKGLSKENSWRLFQKFAFRSQQSRPYDELLVNIAREIADRCAGVPLALRVVGSLLLCQDKSKWLSLRNLRISDIRDNQNDIMHILELSYHNLESPIKSCFSYCALFPKDFVLNKDILMRLWMAQGYIVPLDEGQSINDAAEEYFTILLRRCFFQDVKEDTYGEIESFKIHDLMHDLAQKVAGKEIYLSNSISDNIHEKVRHLAHMGNPVTEYSFTDKIHLRSLLHHQVGYLAEVKMDKHKLELLVKKFTSIRALDLSCTNLQYLPDTIGELLHLRYLNLSKNRDLEELPKSIVKLYNLETLMLHMCEKIKKLPEGISKLLKLRVLEISYCNSLTCIPSDIGRLTELRVVSISHCESFTGMPSDIGNLTKLRVLSISNCSSLTSMPNDIAKLTDLSVLSISDCPCLTYMPSDIPELTELSVLSINNCPSLTCMPSEIGNSTKLRVLNIRNCFNLTCMPSEIGNLKALRILSINNIFPERQ